MSLTRPYQESESAALGVEIIAIQRGMRTLWQNGLQRLLTGQTTLEDTIRVLAADMI